MIHTEVGMAVSMVRDIHCIMEMDIIKDIQVEGQQYIPIGITDKIKLRKGSDTLELSSQGHQFKCKSIEFSDPI
jgi:hypothetical protein